MNIVTFDSLEDMQAHLAENARVAASQVKPWQDAIKIGDYMVSFDPSAELFIYSEVRDVVADELPHLNLDLAEDRIQLEYVQDLAKSYKASHRRCVKSYSPLCPTGELGTAHLCTVVAKLTKDEFEAAKASEWPQSWNALTHLVVQATLKPEPIDPSN